MKRILLAVLIIIATTAVSCDYNRGFQPSEYTTNENIIKSQSFYVSSESTDLDTWISGTIFLSGEDGVVEHAKIVAMVQVDPEDWGGISFLVPYGWRISEITSSYPEDKNIDPAESVNMMYTGGKAESYGFEYNEWITVGDYPSFTPTGGGEGTVIIELDAPEDASIETFNILVGVGSNIKNGVKIGYPDHKVIEIPLV